MARATFQPLQTLHDGAVDVLSMSGPAGTNAAFEWNHLMRDPLVLILPPGHRLVQSQRIGVAALNEERLILHSPTREPGFEWQALDLPKMLSPRHVKEVQVPEAIIDLVEAGLGVSILPRWIVEPELVSGTLVARPLAGAPLWTDWWAVVRANEQPGSATRRVVSALAEWCDRPGNRQQPSKSGRARKKR